jgi:hypothetical protein
MFTILGKLFLMNGFYYNSVTFKILDSKCIHHHSGLLNEALEICCGPRTAYSFELDFFFSKLPCKLLERGRDVWSGGVALPTVSSSCTARQTLCAHHLRY